MDWTFAMTYQFNQTEKKDMTTNLKSEPSEGTIAD